MNAQKYLGTSSLASRGITAAVLALAFLLLDTLHCVQAGQTVSQLGAGSAGPVSSVGGGDSYDSVATPDGRFVLFDSTANNLVSSNGAPLRDYFPPNLNVFRRDRQSGTTSLVSMNAAGTGGGNGNSYVDAISADGRYALFESDASDLVAGDTNGMTDIFLRDMLNGTTTLISVATNGSPGNSWSREATMTPDGRFVAFASQAANLVAGDTNLITDIFVRDTQLNTTVLASPGARPVLAASSTPYTAGSSSEWPVISADGRYVAFYSTATNLVTGNPTLGEVYVRDMSNGVTIWASTNAHLFVTKPASANYAISTNGQYIAYQSSQGTPAGVVFRYNLATGLTDLIMTNGSVPNVLDLTERSIDISADGRFVVFTATNNPSGTTIELWDSFSNALTVVGGTQSGANCEFPRLDQTGRYVLFFDNDSTLTSNSDGLAHGYVRDTGNNSVQMVDVGANGTTPLAEIMMHLSFSATGNLVTFSSFDGVSSISSNKLDVFGRDLVANTTECISIPAAGLASVTGYGRSGITSFSASSNGQYLAFFSEAAGLAVNATNGFRHVYLHDFSSGSNLLVSVAPDGVTPGNFGSFDPATSSDGRYVAFSSPATNLVVNDTNNVEDVYVRDTLSNVTQLASVDAGGAGEGNGNSYTLQLSADGRKVLFFSAANNIVTGSNGGVFWRDMQAGKTYSICTNIPAVMTPDGSNIVFAAATKLWLWQAATGSSTLILTAGTGIADLAVSPDATRAAYGNTQAYTVDLVHHTFSPLGLEALTSSGRLAFSGNGRYLANLAKDSRGTNQLYLYDFVNATNTLISQTYYSGGGASAACDSPAVSVDGRYVAYRSAATNLVPNNVSGAPNIFLYDRLTGGTTLISVSQAGNFAANSRSLQPVFSADGHSLFFESWSTDLGSNDFNLSCDVFALAISSDGLGGLTNVSSSFQISAIGVPLSNGQGGTNQPVTLTWTTVPGAGYQVQFKTNLDDPQWQILNQESVIVGSQGQITDPATNVSQRFYRVISY